MRMRLSFSLRLYYFLGWSNCSQQIFSCISRQQVHTVSHFLDICIFCGCTLDISLYILFPWCALCILPIQILGFLSHRRQHVFLGVLLFSGFVFFFDSYSSEHAGRVGNNSSPSSWRHHLRRQPRTWLAGRAQLSVTTKAADTSQSTCFLPLTPSSSLSTYISHYFIFLFFLILG